MNWPAVVPTNVADEGGPDAVTPSCDGAASGKLRAPESADECPDTIPESPLVPMTRAHSLTISHRFSS